MKCVGQQIGQRHDNNNLTKQGEENRLLLFIEGFKNGLTRILEKHKDKSSEIQLHSGNSILPKLLVGTENVDQETRFGQDQSPHQDRIDQCHDSHGHGGTDHAVRAAGSVIIADDGRGAFGDGKNWCLNHLPDTGNDRHDRNIQISAGMGENIITADGNKAVGKLHDKTCRAEADNIFGVTKTAAKFVFPQKTYF